MPLRPLTEKDLPLVRAWRNTPAVRRNMYSQHEITEVEHQEWFARLKDDNQSLWFIHEDAAGEGDGLLYFTRLQTGNNSTFMGFYAAPNAVPATGTRIEFEALERSFSCLGLHKVNCEVLTSNDQAVNLHKNCGFKEEGLFRDFHFDGQRYCDVVRLGIFAAEWAAKREEIQIRISKLDALLSAKVARGGGTRS